MGEKMSNNTDSQILPEHELYQTFELDEYVERINGHYEYSPEFFYRLLGGTWQSYSSLYWPHQQATMTEAEEAKFSLMAEMMDLKPGMRILDVGCGWGGPLTYFCKTYQVAGVGLMLSENQHAAACERASKYDVNAQFHICPWETFDDSQGFDVIYTDEAIVHFHDLAGFFRRAGSLLKPDGLLLNKELHYTHPRYVPVTRTTEVVNEIFGFTGNYRLLGDELRMVYDSGFEMRRIEQMPIGHYEQTMDHWLSNLFAHREEIKRLISTETYNAFRRYLKIARHIFTTKAVTLDMVLSQKTP